MNGMVAERERGRGRNKEVSSICQYILQVIVPTKARLGPSQELLTGLPGGQQRPKHLSSSSAFTDALTRWIGSIPVRKDVNGLHVWSVADCRIYASPQQHLLLNVFSCPFLCMHLPPGKYHFTQHFNKRLKTSCEIIET